MHGPRKWERNAAGRSSLTAQEGLRQIAGPSVHSNFSWRLLFTPLCRIGRIWFVYFVLVCSRMRSAYDAFGCVTKYLLCWTRDEVCFSVVELLSARLVTRCAHFCGECRLVCRRNRSFTSACGYLCTVVPPYPRVIRSRTYRGYVNSRIIQNAKNNVIFL
jgi:hypothetical protein